MEATPFTTIESAEEFLHLLEIEIRGAANEINSLVNSDDGSSTRRLEALRLVSHKLSQLEANTVSSLRILHDLRTLRTLMIPR